MEPAYEDLDVGEMKGLVTAAYKDLQSCPHGCFDPNTCPYAKHKRRINTLLLVVDRLVRALEEEIRGRGKDG